MLIPEKMFCLENVICLLSLLHNCLIFGKNEHFNLIQTQNLSPIFPSPNHATLTICMLGNFSCFCPVGPDLGNDKSHRQQGKTKLVLSVYIKWNK